MHHANGRAMEKERLILTYARIENETYVIQLSLFTVTQSFNKLRYLEKRTPVRWTTRNGSKRFCLNNKKTFTDYAINERVLDSLLRDNR